MPMAGFRTVLFLIVFYGGSLFHVVLAFVASLTSARLMRAVVSNWSSYQSLCARYILGITVKIDGALHNRPVLYAIKHESMFETIQMPSLFYHPSVVAKIQLARIPFWGFAARRYGMIFVDRDGGAKALRQMLAQSRKVTAQGRPIVIFPEGTRVTRGAHPPLQAGFAGLYKILRLPVVPVAVDSGKCIPRDSWIYHKGVITYKVGAEIPAGLSRHVIEERVHQAINVLNL
jgi:1-acyl-sn-glycerol-3-phosphate acyltransferase